MESGWSAWLSKRSRNSATMRRSGCTRHPLHASCLALGPETNNRPKLRKTKVYCALTTLGMVDTPRGGVTRIMICVLYITELDPFKVFVSPALAPQLGQQLLRTSLIISLSRSQDVLLPAPLCYNSLEQSAAEKPCTIFEPD